MDEQTGHKTFKYKLKPTPEQEQPLDRTLMLSRHVYNAAVGERRIAWRMRGVSVSYYQQKAELPGIKKAMPEYTEVNPRRPRAVPPRVLKLLARLLCEARQASCHAETFALPGMAPACTPPGGATARRCQTPQSPDRRATRTTNCG